MHQAALTTRPPLDYARHTLEMIKARPGGRGRDPDVLDRRVLDTQGTLE
jgi:hypothetical protein